MEERRCKILPRTDAHDDATVFDLRTLAITVAAASATAARSARFIAAKHAALALIARDVDYIQDPTPGRLEGSHPQGGGDGQVHRRRAVQTESTNIRARRLAGGYVKEGVIDTSNVYDATGAVEDRKVELASRSKSRR